MIKFLAGVVFTLLITPIFIFSYVKFGFLSVATDAPPLPFEERLAHMGLDAQVDKVASKTPPFQASKDDYLSAAHLYRQHCASCHGLPGEPKSAIAQGMYPRPPELFKGTGVTDDPPAESYWKIANGIRLTGMPAYKKTLSEKELWEISELVANAGKLPDEVTSALKKPLPIDVE
jgi:mono/diheme cytochrome c family protein